MATDVFRCGHPRTPENSKDNGVQPSGAAKVKCRICHNEREQRRWHTVKPPRSVIRLEVMTDDGEHEPFVSENLGIFANLDAAQAFLDQRFADGFFRCEKHSELAWHLVERETGKDSMLVVIGWKDHFYKTGLERQP